MVPIILFHGDGMNNGASCRSEKRLPCESESGQSTVDKKRWTFYKRIGNSGGGGTEEVQRPIAKM